MNNGRELLVGMLCAHDRYISYLGILQLIIITGILGRVERPLNLRPYAIGFIYPTYTFTATVISPVTDMVVTGWRAAGGGGDLGRAA